MSTRWQRAAGSRPWILGHRGARALAPENTLPSFALALDLGADGVELDLHLSADGVPVVHHDESLMRCTDAPQLHPARAPWSIERFRSAELATLDASCAFSGAKPVGRYHVPTLDEVLAELVPRGALLDLELKTIPLAHEGLLERVLEAVSRARAAELVLLSSFDHQLLRRAGELAPEIPRGVLSAERLVDAAAYVRDAVGAQVFLPGAAGAYAALPTQTARGFDHAGVAREIERCHAAGVQVVPWTVNDPQHQRALLALGVDGLCTDDPRVAALG
jgi:glycerophosphoryl diester phosphodiesterase